MNTKQFLSKIFSLLVLFSILIPNIPANGQEAVVHAVLFYSPSCSHCHKVITEDIPPLIDHYGSQLNIIAINVTVPEGQQLYKAAVEYYNIPDDRLGVPYLFIGDIALFGSIEIPQRLPDIIQEGIANGGIDWPKIPGLQDVLAEASKANNQEGSANIDPGESNTNPEQPTSVGAIDELSLSQKFTQDLVGNSLATIVLIGMVASVFGVGYYFLQEDASRPKPWPSWTIPILILIGVIVAGYLSYVETTQTEAVCGPVGDCNTVQQSPYAVLFGILPIGILGIVGYSAIIIAWLIQQFGPASWRVYAAIMVWCLALLGVLFSIYLTFLEPFVIGATCAWCITSAIVMTLLLWASTGNAKQAFTSISASRHT